MLPREIFDRLHEAADELIDHAKTIEDIPADQRRVMEATVAFMDTATLTDEEGRAFNIHRESMGYGVLLGYLVWGKEK